MGIFTHTSQVFRIISAFSFQFHFTVFRFKRRKHLEGYVFGIGFNFRRLPGGRKAGPEDVLRWIQMPASSPAVT